MKKSEMIKILAKRLSDNEGTIKENISFASELLNLIEQNGMLPPINYNSNWETNQTPNEWEPEFNEEDIKATLDWAQKAVDAAKDITLTQDISLPDYSSWKERNKKT